MKIKHKEKIIGAIVIGVIALVFLSVGYYTTRPQKISQKDMEEIFVDSKATKEGENFKAKDNKNSNQNKLKENSDFITVEIKGFVKKPDVYRLKSGANVKELIEIAGGLTEEGDDSAINRASILKNEQCIIICSKNDKTSKQIENNQSLNNGINSTNQEGKIDLNSATEEQLDSLPGIGKVTAQKIIEYREKHGAFKAIDELKNIGGLGDKKIDKFREKIYVK